MEYVNIKYGFNFIIIINNDRDSKYNKLNFSLIKEKTVQLIAKSMKSS